MARREKGLFGKHRNRLILLFLSVLILFCIVTGAIFSHRYISDIGEANINSARVSIGSVMQSVDLFLREADNLALLVGLDKDVTKALAELRLLPAGDFAYMSQSHHLKEVLTRYINAHAYISNVIPITLNGSFLNEMLLYENERMSEMIHLDRLRGGQENLLFLGNIRPLYYTPSDRVYSCVRKIYSVSGNRSVAGYVQVDIQPDDIDSILEKSMTAGTRAVFLYDGEGEVIKACGDADLCREEDFLLEDGADIVDRNGVRYLMVRCQSAYSRWRLVVMMHYGEISGNARTAATFVGMTFLLGLVLSVLLAFRVVKTTHIPLKQITDQMHEIENGNFDARVNIRTGDEFEYIGEGLNNMSGQLKRQLERLMQEQAMKKDAEMYALQAQINPHFLYNTLAAIRFLIRKGERDRAEKVTVALTELCAAAMDSRPGLIPLRQELSIAQRYFDILQARYGDIIELEVDVPDSFGACGIPKFTLQPIIENAVFHGILLNERGRIRIGAKRAGKMLVIDVSDDGVGMDRDKVKALNKRFKHICEDTVRRAGTFNHIGMENVSNRIMLEFGHPYGLRVSSTPGSLTVVSIRIPMKAIEEVS